MKYPFLTMLLASTAMAAASANAQQPQPQQPPPPQQAQQPAQQPAQAQASQLQDVSVGELMDRQVVSEQGEPIGTVAGVVDRDGGEQFIIIAMMQGQSQVLLPVDRVELRDQQIVARGAIGGQLEGSQPFEAAQQAEFRQVDPQQPVQVGRQQAQAGQQQSGQQQSQQPAGARIRVEQQPAQVEVRQQAPQIIVRQAPPTIIVQQPQPEIIVRMPEPQVAVQQAQPQVRVEQAQPQVRMGAAQAQVRTQQAQPQVTFERTGEPQIQFQEAQGQPQVRIERLGQDQQPQAGQQMQQGGQQAQPAQQQTQAAQPAQPAQQQAEQQQPGRQAEQRDARTMFGVGQEQAGGAAGATEQQQIAVSEIEGAEVFNYQAERLGTVDRVLQNPQSDQFFVVVKHGGFLGLGQSEVVMPLERMVMTGDRLLIQGVTEQDLEAMDDAELYAEYPRAEGDIALGRTN